MDEFGSPDDDFGMAIEDEMELMEQEPQMKLRRTETGQAATRVIDGVIRVDLKDTTNIINDPENDLDYTLFKRRDVPANIHDDNSRILSFMQVDVDDYVSQPNPTFVQSENNEVPILRMYGVTPEGNSVLAHIHGFTPYFYCPVASSNQGAMADAVVFSNSLEQQLKQSRVAMNLTKNVLSVEVVTKTNIMEYSENGERPYFKVHLALQRLVQESRKAVETGFMLTGGGHYPGLGTYETNVPLALRFLVDQSLGGGSWVDISRQHYTVRKQEDCTGACQMEIDVHYKHVIPSTTQDEASIAPIRIVSFDIECYNQMGKGFPEAERNPVIQIAAELKEVGSDKNVDMVWTLDSCGDIANARVWSFQDERDMLVSFARWLRAADCDFISGYNIINFDLPYLLKRAESLAIAGDFSELGRLKGLASRIREFTNQNGRPQKEIKCEGRIIFDMYSVIAKEHNLRSYTLNFVSSHFLGDQKEDVHYSLIGTLHTGSAETRRRLAIYCLKDAKLPLRLLDKLCCLYNYVEMARVTGTPINFLLFRGQMIKVVSQILRKSRKDNYIVPTKKVEATEDKFEGATVLDPKTSYYQTPIATLDFASLYPSIMMAHNLCYCTLIPQNRIVNNSKVIGMEESDYTITPCGNFFVKPQKRKGLLPQILEELLGARKKAKKQMNVERDPFKKAVLNGRQLALKVSANSVYGFTGAQVGQMPCLEISSSVTAFGRTMIESTKKQVEENFTIANGYEHDAEVVYGDTDSVMVKFGCETVAESMKLGELAADMISKTFINPIKLEFEKVYFPYLLLAKKRYAGLYWTSPDKYDKLDTKGIETVRRDNCGIVQRVVDTALRNILIDRSLEKAIKFVQDMVSDLLQNKVDLSLLIISKSLGRGDASAYAAKQAHVELAERMRIRNPATAPGPGDRVPYVIVKSMKKTANYEKSEDPMYVLENGLSIDAHWYIDHQLAGPLLRIFDPIIKNASQRLFTGDHTRKIVSQGGSSANAMMAAGQDSQGGMGSNGLVANKTVARKCLGCKITLKSSHSNGTNTLSLCEHCLKSKGPEIYFKQMEVVREKQVEYQRLWTECQRCQNAIHQEVLCANCDCPIFYKRQKARIDLQKTEAQLQSLKLDW